MRLRTALLVICGATALAVVPAAAGDEPATLETLPAAQADERLADLGVPASDIAEAVEVLDEARSDPDAEIVGDTVVWEDGASSCSSSAPWPWRTARRGARACGRTRRTVGR